MHEPGIRRNDRMLPDDPVGAEDGGTGIGNDIALDAPGRGTAFTVGAHVDPHSLVLSDRSSLLEGRASSCPRSPGPTQRQPLRQFIGILFAFEYAPSTGPALISIRSGEIGMTLFLPQEEVVHIESLDELLIQDMYLFLFSYGSMQRLLPSNAFCVRSV